MTGLDSARLASTRLDWPRLDWTRLDFDSAGVGSSLLTTPADKGRHPSRKGTPLRREYFTRTEDSPFQCATHTLNAASAQPQQRNVGTGAARTGTRTRWRRSGRRDSAHHHLSNCLLRMNTNQTVHKSWQMTQEHFVCDINMRQTQNGRNEVLGAVKHTEVLSSRLGLTL